MQRDHHNLQKNTPGPQATVTYFERSPTTVASTSRAAFVFLIEETMRNNNGFRRPCDGGRTGVSAG